MRPLAIALAACLCCACSEDDAAPPPAAPEVRVFGTVHSVMQGQWAPVVALEQGLSGGYGLGALSDLRGEFVAIPGQIWLSYPTTEALPEVRQTERSDETAALLVAATVPAFRKTSVSAHIPSTSLEAQIAALAQQAGVDVSRPFPFLIQGRLRAVHWHVVDGTRVTPGTRPDESAQKGVLDDAEGTVVGFYSSQHQGVFTMQGQNAHMHVFAPEAGVAGHVTSLEVPAGSSLSFP
jgi:alpha-acetolactate decarboxylase